MTKTTFSTTIVRDGPICFIPVPFDPKPVFGKIRAPVKVTLNGYTYRSTIASMGGTLCIPLRKSNREAAGLSGAETLDVTLDVTLEHDVDERTVEPPADLVAALKATQHGWARWQALSHTRRRESVEAVETARKPDTRRRRIARIANDIVAGVS